MDYYLFGKYKIEAKEVKSSTNKPVECNRWAESVVLYGDVAPTHWYGPYEIDTKTGRWLNKNTPSIIEEFTAAQREDRPANLTKSAKEIASAQWSAQLRQKIAESEAKAKVDTQVVVDIDYDLM